MALKLHVLPQSFLVQLFDVSHIQDGGSSFALVKNVPDHQVVPREKFVAGPFQGSNGPNVLVLLDLCLFQLLLRVEIVARKNSSLKRKTLSLEGLVQAVENACVEIALQLIALYSAHVFELSEVLWLEELLLFRVLLEKAVFGGVKSGLDFSQMSEDEVLRDSIEVLVDVEDVSEDPVSRGSSNHLFESAFFEELGQDIVENSLGDLPDLLFIELLLPLGLPSILPLALSLRRLFTNHLGQDQTLGHSSIQQVFSKQVVVVSVLEFLVRENELLLVFFIEGVKFVEKPPRPTSLRVSVLPLQLSRILPQEVLDSLNGLLFDLIQKRISPLAVVHFADFVVEKLPLLNLFLGEALVLLYYLGEAGFLPILRLVRRGKAYL